MDVSSLSSHSSLLTGLKIIKRWKDQQATTWRASIGVQSRSNDVRAASDDCDNVTRLASLLKLRKRLHDKFIVQSDTERTDLLSEGYHECAFLVRPSLFTFDSRSRL